MTMKDIAEVMREAITARMESKGGHWMAECKGIVLIYEYERAGFGTRNYLIFIARESCAGLEND